MPGQTPYNTNNSSLAKGCREFLASTESAPNYSGETVDQEGKFKNTMLCVDVKTILLFDHIMKLGKKYPGLLMMDREDHLLFQQSDKCKTNVKRNIPFFPGTHLNCTVRPEDLHVRLNFKELNFSTDFNIDTFAIEVMMEVRKVLYEAKGLIEEKSVSE